MPDAWLAMSSETNTSAASDTNISCHRPQWPMRWLGAVAAGFLLGSGSHLMAILGYWLSTTSFGSTALSLAWPVSLVAGMGLLTAVAALPTGCMGCLFERWHRTGIWLLIASLVTLVWFFLASATTGRWAMSKRMAAFGELAAKMTPLVQAIQRYEQDHGKPPGALGDLIPHHIASMPSTGMPAIPKLRYLTGEEAQAHEGNPWVLTIFCTSGGINFDQFMYFPKQNYPREGYSGRLDRVRDWAYVHE